VGGQVLAAMGMRSRLLLHPAEAETVESGVAAAPAFERADVARSAVIMKSADVATVNPAYLRFLNPVFRTPVSGPSGQPRTAFSLPTMVSPSVTPDDATLFEDPQDVSRKFFLTDYAIAATGAGGATGKWVSFSPSGSGFVLSVHLADVTSPDKVGGNGRLAPDTRYLLSATVQSRTVSWDLTVGAPADDGSLVLTLAVPDFAGRDLLYAAMTDPSALATLVIRRSLSLAVPSDTSGTYSATTRAIDSPISFTFSKDLDAQVFAGLHGVAATPLAPWKVLSLSWNGRNHTYYQSATQPDQVLFLPDCFKVGRQASARHLPDLAVTAHGETAASMMMTLSYLAAPIWDPKRIAAALPKLQQMLGLAQPPNMAVFEASSTSLMLSLPVGSGGAELVAQPNALIDLAAGIQGSVTLGLEPFRQLYEALFDPVGSLLSGEVRVSVADDVAAVPFIARMGDLAGDVLDVRTAVDGKSNSLIATLTNAIESPVHLAGLSAVITRKGEVMDGTGIRNISPPLPLDLAPGDAAASPGSLTVTLGTSATNAVTKFLGGLFGRETDQGSIAGDAAGIANLLVDGDCAPLFDFSQVTVKPDPKAMWRAIMANGAPSPVTRVINLKFLATSLKGTSGPDGVVAMQVVFQGGQTASFDGGQTPDASGFITQVVTLSVPIEAFVLQDVPTDSYTYRIDVVTPGGIHQGSWTTDNRDTLYVVSG
jgi:hypothetical protein